MKTRPKLEAQAAPSWDHSCNIHTMPFTDTHTVKQLRQSLYMMSYKKGKKKNRIRCSASGHPSSCCLEVHRPANTRVHDRVFASVYRRVAIRRAEHDRVFARVYRRVGIRRAVTRSCVCQRIPTCGNT